MKYRWEYVLVREEMTNPYIAVAVGQKLIAGLTFEQYSCYSKSVILSERELSDRAQRRPVAMSLEPALCLSDEMGVNISFLNHSSFGNLSPHQDPSGDVRAPQTTSCKTESSPNIFRGQKPWRKWLQLYMNPQHLSLTLKNILFFYIVVIGSPQIIDYSNSLKCNVEAFSG